MSKLSEFIRKGGLGIIAKVVSKLAPIVAPVVGTPVKIVLGALDPVLKLFKKKETQIMAEGERTSVTDVLKSLPGLKAGPKTTEFYVTIGTVGTFLTQALEASNSDLLRMVAIAAAALASAAYSIARGLAKKAATPS